MFHAKLSLGFLFAIAYRILEVNLFLKQNAVSLEYLSSSLNESYWKFNFLNCYELSYYGI